MASDSDTTGAKPGQVGQEKAGSEPGEKMVRASLAVLAARIFIPLFGLIQAIIIGQYFGRTALTDGFLFALEGVIMMFFFATEKIVLPPVLPIFVESLSAGDEQKGWRMASALFNWLLLVLAVFAVLLCAFPEGPVRFFSWMMGREMGAGRIEQAAYFVRWGAPTLVAMSLGALTYSVLNGYRRFFWAAFGEVSAKMAIVAGLVVGGLAGGAASNAAGAKWVAVGLFVMGFARLATHVFALRDKLKFYRVALTSPQMKRVLLLAAPLVVGVIVARARDIINNYGVLIVLEEGLLTANSFGRKIFTSLGGLVPFSVAIAMFPFFCEMIDRNDRKALAKYLSQASRMLLLLFVPIAAGAIVLSLPMSRMLFQGGRTDLAGVRLASLANSCYVAVLPAYALEAVIVQAFFSDRRTIAPTVIGIVCSSASILVSWLAVAKFGATGAVAIVSVALGYTASRYVKIVWLIGSLRRTVPAFPFKETLTFLLRCAVVAAATAGVAYGVRILYESKVDVYAQVSGRIEVLKLVGPGLLLSVASGGAAFLATAKLLRMRELDDFINWLLQKLRARR